MSMIPVKPHIVQQAHIKSLEEYKQLYYSSLRDPDQFWRKEAQALTWYHHPHSIIDYDHEAVDFAWFGGGMLNACFNCVDRHAIATPDKPAIIWAKDEPGQYEYISYRDLKHAVARFANVLIAHGVKKGDRVCIYMPMIPQAAYAMLACARIGAVHSVVFGGFSAESLRGRIIDAGCKVVITSNEGLRGGKRLALKKTTDQAVEGLAQVQTVLVARRTDADVPMQPGRDFWLDAEMDKQRSTCPCEWMHSEDPLFVLYTSGSTGKPKGLLHTTAGYLVYASLTHKLVFDYHEGDIHFCAADVGWVTGHSYIVYGPLANGATTVMFESIPTYPDAGRYWQIIDDISANIFYTAPTALRAILREGNQFVTKYKRDSLRVLGSVGEPINPEVWQWYHDVVGEGRCAVVDTWWQTETGGILITPLPGVTPCKPGSATLPFFGVQPVVVDEKGNELKGNGVSGNLCLRGSWPGQARTIYGDHSRFKQTYFSTYPGLYFTGDGCKRDEDGYYWITGRVDDVINVSGHRLGTAEIESALITHEAVAEAAVTGYPHDLKGTGIYAFVVIKPEYEKEDREELAGAFKNAVRREIGAIATPDVIQIVSGLPKTRSGKIMRRILRKIAAGEYSQLGDITTLADPGVVEKIVIDHKAAK